MDRAPVTGGQMSGENHGNRFLMARAADMNPERGLLTPQKKSLTVFQRILRDCGIVPVIHTVSRLTSRHESHQM